jgi:cytochrome c6
LNISSVRANTRVAFFNTLPPLAGHCTRRGADRPWARKEAMMKKSTITILVLVAAFSFSTVAAHAADGAAVFKQKCIACHGATASGARDLTSAKVQGLTDAQLTDFIANGGPAKKPAHTFKAKGLTDDDVKAVIAYIRTLKK